MKSNFLESVEQLIHEIEQILNEKKLTTAEKEKREEVAKAIEKDDPDMPMDKKMAIATSTAKRVAEEATNLEDIDIDIDNYFTRQDDEEEGRFDNTPTEDLLNPDMPAPWEKI
jgi:hypothetical protein